MKAYTYILTHDSGFAPNPFWGFCTLATCKPKMRSSASMDDWVVGVGSVNTVGAGKLVYAMQVCEVLSFDEYDRDPRFQSKKPKVSGSRQERCGDNIYHRGSDGRWHQRPNPHHGRGHLKRDVQQGRHVLVAKTFYYFGADALEIPRRFKELIPVTQGHRSRFGAELIQRFLSWLSQSAKPGVYGEPFAWVAGDKGTGACCPLRH
ncbi:MAG: hypothetical protein ACE5MG_10315 [Candidatus Methylomirabilales bacterium]